MTESIGDRRAPRGPGRKLLMILVLGLVAWASCPPAQAGPIRRQVALKATLQPSAANQWGPYWEAALKYHWMNVHGPRGVTLLKLSADGTLPVSPFVEYLQWRQGLAVKRFDAFHPGIARLLRHVRAGSMPSLNPTPTEPPDFEAISPQEINPPTVPEPSSAVIAAMLVGAAAVARRRARRS